MNTNVLRKSLVVGVIFLFIGMNITSIVSSLSIENHFSINGSTEKLHTVMNAGLRGVNITLNGTMGENGWYVSDVYVSINCSESNHIYFRIDEEGWQEYVVPLVITITTDGYHTVSCYYIDSEGHQSDTFYAYFKIDQTKPYAWFAIAKIRFGKWFIYANASDITSGMDKVEFYVEDVFQGTVFEPPYLWICNGSMRFSLVIAYDKAGNYCIPQIPDPYPILHTRMTGIISNVNITEESVSFHAILVFTYHGILRDEQVTYPNSYVGYIGGFCMNAVFYPSPLNYCVVQNEKV